MSTLAIALGALVLYLIAYNTYGKWLAGKIFKLDPDAIVPSVALNDDKDFVPTKKGIIFGHHFTSIAGTGPIVGPALAVIWGWVPALLWVLFGSILIGAVHDFGSLVVSIRNRGQTVGDIAGRILTKRTRLLFLSILFMALTIVLAIFGLVIANVFDLYPSAIFPCLVQIPIAVFIGVSLHRQGINILIPSVIALVVMYVSIIFSDWGIFHVVNHTLGGEPGVLNDGLSLFAWVLVLLIYSYIASVLPVWTLLQPRDFINSLQLLSALALVVLGLGVAAIIGGAPIAAETGRISLEIVAPAFRWAPEGAPWIFPFLFITIACGAVSGFHCLVSSGTSSKQIKCETDAQFVGYGSMLTEGFLATLVILACVAGLGLGAASAGGELLTGSAAYDARYESWNTAQGLGAKIGAFIEGSANFLRALGLSAAFSVALMGVFVASFAATTLDTACRLQRYVIQELASTFAPQPGTSDLASGKSASRNPLGWLTNKHGATVFAIVLAGLIAAIPLPGSPWGWASAGKGGLILWPLFGATNQLLGGLAFLVITFWMWRRNLPIFFVAIPTVFMLLLPGLAMGVELFKPNGWLALQQWHLVFIGVATVALEVWMIAEALIAWPKAKGVLEPSLPPLPGSLRAEPQTEGGRSC
ncbi:MAG: carbon starvation protein A [Verrucomicrobia bacterium]|nr:carbon starvation protein A [Verrucomicrobiota bacterium]MDA1068802.1 carbon starvation protein A [Verrucomicrobiota bacterium]